MPKGQTRAQITSPAWTMSKRGNSYSLTPNPCIYPRTETPENESTANPRTGCPKNRAGSK